MAVLRLEAFRRLAAAIAEEIPELAGDRIIIQHAPPSRIQNYPTLVLDPVRFAYIRQQAQLVYSPTFDTGVFNVGRWDVVVQARLAAATQGERFDLEERLSNLFAKQVLRPGTLLTTVTALPELGEFNAAWCLDGDEWDDGHAADRYYEGVTVIDGSIPTLVTRNQTYDIEHLKLGLTSDMTTEFDAETFLTSPEIELREIHEDGTITPV